jgi:hypothetical protein
VTAKSVFFSQKSGVISRKAFSQHESALALYSCCTQTSLCGCIIFFSANSQTSFFLRSCFDVQRFMENFLPSLKHNVLCLLIAKQKQRCHRARIDQKHIRPLCKNKSRRVSCLRRGNLCLLCLDPFRLREYIKNITF